jgi:hypothetical protein
MEYRGTHNRRYPGGSVVKKALKTRSPGFMILDSRYRLIGRISAEIIARCYAEGQSAHCDQDHRRTPASATMVSQID